LPAVPGKIVHPAGGSLFSYATLRQKQDWDLALRNLAHHRFHASHARARAFHEIRPHWFPNHGYLAVVQAPADMRFHQRTFPRKTKELKAYDILDC
jgi:hypothetical protein